MSTFNAVQDAIVQTLKAAPELKMLRTVEAHDGSIDEAEIDRVFTAMPAALVVVLGSEEHKTIGDRGVSDASCAVFVLVDGAKPRARARKAAAISEAILEVARKQTWGVEAVIGVPKRSRAENLYARGVDGKGVALWQVRWSQQMSLTKEIALSTLNDFNKAAGVIEHGGERAPDANVEVTLNPVEE